MPAWNNTQDPIMMSAQDDVCHCPHCGRMTRHSVVRERVLAPVLWCLSCFHARVGNDGHDPSILRPTGRPVGDGAWLAG